jgi:hypothetical protein
MSFSDLKAAKKGKSYVQSHSPSSESAHATDTATPKTEVYKSDLPLNIEVRVLPGTGRGLWSKERIPTGISTF